MEQLARRTINEPNIRRCGVMWVQVRTCQYMYRCGVHARIDRILPHIGEVLNPRAAVDSRIATYAEARKPISILILIVLARKRRCVDGGSEWVRARVRDQGRRIRDSEVKVAFTFEWWTRAGIFSRLRRNQNRRVSRGLLRWRGSECAYSFETLNFEL